MRGGSGLGIAAFLALHRSYFILDAMAFCASSWLYSLLATPPTGMVGKAASKSSWVKAR